MLINQPSSENFPNLNADKYADIVLFIIIQNKVGTAQPVPVPVVIEIAIVVLTIIDVKNNSNVFLLRTKTKMRKCMQACMLHRIHCESPEEWKAVLMPNCLTGMSEYMCVCTLTIKLYIS